MINFFFFTDTDGKKNHKKVLALGKKGNIRIKKSKSE